MRSLCDHNSNRLGVELALIDPVFLPVIRGVGGGGGGCQWRMSLIGFDTFVPGAFYESAGIGLAE